MSIKDKITLELKDRFIAAIKESMKTGRENRFVLCSDKEGNLYPSKSTCPSYLQLEGEFHTHPYATIEKKRFEEETHTKIPLENIKKLLIEENKKLKRDISGPSYNDVLNTLSLKCRGQNGTVCIINDLEPDRLECWIAKTDFYKEDCERTNKELNLHPKGSPQPWIENLFDKEIIKLKTEIEIEEEKRKLRENERRLERRLETEKRKLEEKRKIEALKTEIEQRKELFLGTKSKKKLCRSLQEIVSEVKDPDSIFIDIDLVRKYTGCPIPTKKKEKNKI